MISALTRQAKKHFEAILSIFALAIVFYVLKSVKGPGALRREKIELAGEDEHSTIEPRKWVPDPKKVYPPEHYQIPTHPHSNCSPKQNLYFLRTHQTGTSSVTNIFYRYGKEHDLNFVMYPLKLHLNYPGRINMLYLERMMPETGYNILSQYTRHHDSDILRIMNSGTIFTTLLRHPVDQFLSVFNNFDLKQEMKNLLPHHNPYEEFFRRPDRIAMLASDSVYHLIQNSMSFDLGLNTPHFKNSTAVDQFVEKIDREFHLVLILELLDESLVLLKRLMCWDLNQLVYVKLSINKEYSLSISDEIREKIMDWNSIDMRLYNHFSDKMKTLISEQDEDFHKEVALLKQINTDFSKECYEKVFPVYNGNKIGYNLRKSHETNLTCKELATDDVTQTHVIGLKQFKDKLPPSDILMVRNHMQNLKKHNPAMLDWTDVYRVLHPEKSQPEKNEL